MKNLVNIVVVVVFMILLKSCSYNKKELNFKNDLIRNDTSFVYHSNSNIKEKGLLKNGNKSGWWSFYDPNGMLLSKKEYYSVNGKSVENQIIYYDEIGNINKNKGSYFELKIKDTLLIGENYGRISLYNTSKFGDYKLISVIIDNEYENNIIKRDTFSDGTQIPSFGLYFNKKGNRTIKGIIEEKILIEKEVSPDSSILRIENYYKYFEKDVFIKDR